MFTNTCHSYRTLSIVSNITWNLIWDISGLILGFHLANERRCYVPLFVRTPRIVSWTGPSFIRVMSPVRLFTIFTPCCKSCIFNCFYNETQVIHPHFVAYDYIANSFDMIFSNVGPIISVEFSQFYKALFVKWLLYIHKSPWNKSKLKLYMTIYFTYGIWMIFRSNQSNLITLLPNRRSDTRPNPIAEDTLYYPATDPITWSRIQTG